MATASIEIRDPLHVFVKLVGDEKPIIDSRPFQRLRHIHQLALSGMVYPGASHKRFEHSLGVMELAVDVERRLAADRLDRAQHLVQETRVGAADGDDNAEVRGAGRLSSPGGAEHVLQRQERVALGRRVEVDGLRAETAILRTATG